MVGCASMSDRKFRAHLLRDSGDDMGRLGDNTIPPTTWGGGGAARLSPLPVLHQGARPFPRRDSDAFAHRSGSVEASVSDSCAIDLEGTP